MKIVVDPVTRIEGHLRIETQVDAGAVTDAWSTSPMFRGIENVLVNRDPRDAWVFTQRICGVCTTVSVAPPEMLTLLIECVPTSPLQAQLFSEEGDPAARRKA